MDTRTVINAMPFEWFESLIRLSTFFLLRLRFILKSTNIYSIFICERRRVGAIRERGWNERCRLNRPNIRARAHPKHKYASETVQTNQSYDPQWYICAQSEEADSPFSHFKKKKTHCLQLAAPVIIRYYVKIYPKLNDDWQAKKNINREFLTEYNTTIDSIALLLLLLSPLLCENVPLKYFAAHTTMKIQSNPRNDIFYRNSISNTLMKWYYK